MGDRVVEYLGGFFCCVEARFLAFGRSKRRRGCTKTCSVDNFLQSECKNLGMALIYIIMQIEDCNTLADPRSDFSPGENVS